MKRYYKIIIITLLLFNIFGSFQTVSAKPSQVIPTFVIVSVEKDLRVTIRTANFPPNKDFIVTMGKNHTLGVGGIVVATTNSGAGGSFQATYDIPLLLKGQEIIAIRLQAKTGKYYAYNWFPNLYAATYFIHIHTPTPQGTPGTPATPISTTPGVTLQPTKGTYFWGYPYFGITGVVQDSKVSVSGANFPLNTSFNVLMGPYGSYGFGGTQVASLNTGASGVFNASYDIPATFKGLDRIAIRFQSTNNQYYAYNWFFNRTTGIASPVTNLSFSIQSIEIDKSVTILSQNFPVNIEYDVLMGVYGTQGINGISTGTTKTSTAGSFSATFQIPSGLKGQERIAIRLVGKDGSFAYNWFYNVSASIQ